MITLQERAGRQDEFFGAGKSWTLKSIGIAIRDGESFKIFSSHKEDITKNILCKIAFMGLVIGDRQIQSLSERRLSVEDVLVHILSEDAILDLIEMGGASEYITKKLSGRL